MTNYEFLFAYRSFAREYHVKKESDNAYEIMRQELPEEKRNLADLALLGTRTSLAQLEKQRVDLNDWLKKSEFCSIKTRRFEFYGEFELAVSSMFAIQCDFKGKIINDLSDLEKDLRWSFLNVFPQKGKTYVLLSCFSKDNKFLVVR